MNLRNILLDNIICDLPSQTEKFRHVPFININLSNLTKYIKKFAVVISCLAYKI